MGQNAYIVRPPDDPGSWIHGEFRGGDPNRRHTFLVNGEMMRNADLRACLLMGVKAPDQLVLAAPNEIFIEDGFGRLPDFGAGPWGGFTIVSENFVEIVELLDPDQHQFIPIDRTYYADGRLVDKKFFIMNIFHKINAVDLELSNVRKVEKTIIGRNGLPDQTRKYIEILEPFSIFLRKDRIGNLNIWHGTSNDIFKIFFSDKLVREIKKLKLSPLSFTAVNVI